MSERGGRCREGGWGRPVITRLFVEHLRASEGLRYAGQVCYMRGCNLQEAMFLKDYMVTGSDAILMRDVNHVTVTVGVES